MATYSTRDFEQALISKGYQEDKTHHKMFWYYIDGKKTSVRTRTSNGEKEFDDYILSERRKQMGLSKKQDVIDYIECSLTEQQYRDILVNSGRVRL